MSEWVQLCQSFLVDEEREDPYTAGVPMIGGPDHLPLLLLDPTIERLLKPAFSLFDYFQNGHLLKEIISSQSLMIWKTILPHKVYSMNVVFNHVKQYNAYM